MKRKQIVLFAVGLVSAVGLTVWRSQPAPAYVETPFALGRVVQEANFVLVMQVESVDKQRNIIIYRKQQDIKGIKMRPVTAEHDFQVRLRATQRFLEEGDKVKVTIQFKAREITHPELAKRLMDKFVAAITEQAIIEKPPSIEGKMMTMILSPKVQ